MLSKEIITDWFLSLQDTICKALEQEDGLAKFQEDIWERKEGGGGRTRIIQNGNVIEKGGVLFSAVHGPIPDFLKSDESSIHSNTVFYATGVSIVIHPKNPMVPIIHMNVRYFEMNNGIWWFGGGIDLTPHYINKENAHFFHLALKKVCDKHHVDFYQKFKIWADDYFYLPHRNETRGVGGIFFDKLNDEGLSKEQLFSFVKAVGEVFAPTYTSIMSQNKNLPFDESHKKWQLLRRGRYVEFNLLYDKGTRFGLETNGRTESILMSLPETASWLYNYNPTKNSQEELTINSLKKGINWIE